MVTLIVSLVLLPNMTEVDTKNRIKGAAHMLMMQYGIRSVSMDDIATHLGMSKKTIYQYFRDKDELVETVVDEILTANRLTCNADKARAENVIHEIFLAMDMLEEMFKTMNPGILFDMQKYHPAAFRKFLKHKNEFIYQECTQNLQRGIAEGFYRPGIVVDIICRFRVETMFIPFNPEFQQNLKHKLLKIEEEIIIHYLYGLVSVKGYKLVEKYLGQKIKSQK